MSFPVHFVLCRTDGMK